MDARSRDRVTIVTGLPRSGTSLMMRMLEAGGVPVLVDGVRPPDADNPRGYYEFEPVKRTRADPSWLARAGGRAVKMVYRLLCELPDDRSYRVLFMERRLCEVFASQEAMLERRERRDEPMDLDGFERRFGADVARVKEWLRDRPNFRVLEVGYRGLIDDPGPRVRAIDAFLGGGLDTAAMQQAIEPALVRRRD